MVTLSVSVPENLKQKMIELDEVNWSAVARRAFEEKIKQISFLKRLAGKSKLTEKDALEISNKINIDMARKFKEIN